MKATTAQLILHPLSHVLMGPICPRAVCAQTHRDPGQERHALVTIEGPSCVLRSDDDRSTQKK